MYKKNEIKKSLLKVNNSVEGETIEKKVDRILNNKEPIKDRAPLVYTERKDGVQAATDIRTDRFEIAVDALDQRQKTMTAKRQGKTEMKAVKGGNGNESGAGDTGAAANTSDSGGTQ